MPNIRTENFSTGDQSWLASSHGLRNARTKVLDISTFTKTTHYPQGFIPSGTPVGEVDGKLVPYDAAAETGASTLVGHILTDQTVTTDADFGVPLFDHGRINAAKIAAILPAYASFTAPAAEKNATNILYI